MKCMYTYLKYRLQVAVHGVEELRSLDDLNEAEEETCSDFVSSAYMSTFLDILHPLSPSLSPSLSFSQPKLLGILILFLRCSLSPILCLFLSSSHSHLSFFIALFLCIYLCLCACLLRMLSLSSVSPSRSLRLSFSLSLSSYLSLFLS